MLIARPLRHFIVCSTFHFGWETEQVLSHEYGGPAFFAFRQGDHTLDLIAKHLRVLFQDAVRTSRRPNWKVLLDKVASTIPRGTKFRLMDERNSVGISLGYESIATASALDRKLGLIVDEAGKQARFGFSEMEIAHVCAADPMAALAFITSRSGFVRELGLSRIDGLGPNIGFALVVLRLNDRVPEVRAAAVNTIERLMRNDVGPNGGLAFNIAGSIGLLLNSKKLNRMSQPERAVAEALIRYPGVKEAIRSILLFGSTGDHNNQNLRAIIQAGFADDLLPEIAERSECSYRRLIASRSILYGKYSWKDEGRSLERKLGLDAYTAQVVRSALLDKSANVAFAALGYLIETRDLRGLDNRTVEKLLMRQEASLQRRIGVLRGMVGK